MNSEPMQDVIDEIWATSAQQWMLRLIAGLTPIGAVVAATAANGSWWPAGLFLVGSFAFTASVRPDTAFALITLLIVLWHWLVVVDDVSTPWLPVACISLLAFHSVISLLATLATGGELPGATLGQWTRRLALVSCATVVMWTIVVLFDQREATGNGLLTALALAIVAAGTVMVRSRSLTSAG